MPPSGLVHLIDDDEDVRRALAFLLGTAGLAVRVYESATAFLDRCDDFQTGCIVSDIRMPGMDGLQLMHQLQNKGSRLPVIVMTGHADVPLAVSAMKAGAVDFIEKPFGDDVLLAAIEAAFDHGSKALAAGQEAAQVRTRLESLTPREKEVLDGLLVGHPNKTIAYDLGLSPRTVEVHRANVMTKMGASSLPELVRMTISAGNP
jgi:two-component system response regulator FixJ